MTLDSGAKSRVREMLVAAGASEAGFAMAGEVASGYTQIHSNWLAEGCNAGMAYMARHAPLKSDTSSVLPGANTVICISFSYAPAVWRNPELPMVACYAYGEDYHDVIRRRLLSVVEKLKGTFGGEWRVCIDSAPLAERYWAMQSGLGILGRNGSVITEKCGSMGFLAEILTTVSFEPDIPSRPGCLGCGKCTVACPTGALSAEGRVDARRCLSYLTIEHRGEWESREMSDAMQTETGRRTLFGCDICQRVCPHNGGIAPSAIGEFAMRKEIGSVSAAGVMEMTQKEFSEVFKGSPVKRSKLEGLQRNAMNILRDKS